MQADARRAVQTILRVLTDVAARSPGGLSEVTVRYARWAGAVEVRVGVGDLVVTRIASVNEIAMARDPEAYVRDWVAQEFAILTGGPDA